MTQPTFSGCRSFSIDFVHLTFVKPSMRVLTVLSSFLHMCIFYTLQVEVEDVRVYYSQALLISSSAFIVFLKIFFGTL